MPINARRTHHVMTQCKRIRESWSEAERARRRRLGKVRSLKVLHWLTLAERRQCAAETRFVRSMSIVSTT
jgi:hypothetical protein